MINIEFIEEWSEGFYNQIVNDIKETIVNDCVKLMYETMKEMIYKTVYNEYNPTVYQRRYEDGGLADMGLYDFQLDVNSDGFNIRMYTNVEGIDGGNLQGKPLDECIVEGNNYSWLDSQIYQNQPYPRDFYKATFDALIYEGALHYILENELGKKGIKIV